MTLTWTWGCTRPTVETRRSKVSDLLRRTWRRRLSGVVPAARAKAKPKRFLSHGELARLADECGDYSPLINSLGYTGLRWGEAVALQVENLDLLRRRIRVTRAMAEVRGKAVVGTPKDHERRDVPIPAFLVDDLADLVAARSPTELVFPSPKSSILRNGNFRRNVFDAAADRAGLGGITPHGLRHTAASLAIQAGATVVVVSRMLGHSSAKITLDVYAHLFADDLSTRSRTASTRLALGQVRTKCGLVAR